MAHRCGTVKYILKTLLFVVIFVLMLYGASATSYGCCIPSNPISVNPFQSGIVTAGAEVTEADCTQNELFVAECVDEDTGLLPPVIETNCCCNGNSVVPFGTQNNLPPYFVYKLYCENYEYSSIDPTGSECICEGSSGGVVNSNVSGYVRLNNDTGVLLEDITIQHDSSNIWAETDSEGYYNLGFVPAPPTGINLFSATAPEPYSATINGEEKELDCEIEPRTITFEENQGNTEVNFTLTCVMLGAPCIPDWEVSEWSDCILYGGASYIRTRT